MVNSVIKLIKKNARQNRLASYNLNGKPFSKTWGGKPDKKSIRRNKKFDICDRIDNA